MGTVEVLTLGLITALFIIGSMMVSRRKKARKILQAIREQWGKEPEFEYKAEDLQAISSYFENLKTVGKEDFFIDNITWNDLDMDSIFKRMNNTQTTTGEEYLYALLREPVFDGKELLERHRLMEFFRQHPAERERLQFLLARLGKKRFTGVSDHFLCGKSGVSLRGLKYILLSAAFLLSPLLTAVNFALGMLAIIGTFIINMTVYYHAKRELSSYLESLGYLVNLIGCSKKLARMGIREIVPYTDRIKQNAGRIKGFSINSFYALFYMTQDPFLEYVKVVLLGELIAFESLLKKVNQYREEIRCLFETVGYLDSIISMASYRESLSGYTTPTLYKKEKTKGIELYFKDACHPLIKNPVANSLELRRAALITGSNASGKSTFLKTIAINAILAQTAYTCLATHYRSCFFKIFTSMALRDNLFNNESYYIAEIKSLKRIFDQLNEEVPLLCMIDEVLRGTNTIERIAASSEVLYKLSTGNCLCVAATHDLELTSVLTGHYENYHFQEYISDRGVDFDYRIYPGKSHTRNAIKLLKFTGYSREIVDRAEARALEFMQNGKWSEIGQINKDKQK